MKTESLQAILFAIAQAGSVDQILREIIAALDERPKTVLARIWLMGDGDLCATCRFKTTCPNQTRCLHLVASAGRSQVTGQEYNRLDGRFRRMPLGVSKIGRVASTGEPFLISEVTPEQDWVADPEWIRAEGIRGFAGQPLIFRGEVLGVLGVFERQPLTSGDFQWLRTFADFAAVALANARAFEEIEQLKSRLERENDYLRQEVSTALSFGEIVGQSEPLQKVLRQVELVAPTDASVLILGESGTGKELVARAIHERSARKNHPLIKVNCGAIPHELFESEFFGHVKGAFTGAIKDRVGRFELADGGTLFLDEIGEIPLPLQAKLLRILQEQQFERVGEERTRRINVRIVAATNRDLKNEVAAGRFRQDLYYRLTVFPIELPPLRQRLGDLPLLAAHFLQATARKLNLNPGRLPAAEIEKISKYDWPGNVRELQNVIERAVILSQGGPLRLEALASSGNLPSTAVRPAEPQRIMTCDELKRLERDNIIGALAATKGRIFGPSGAAKLLGIKGTTLGSRMKALGIKKSQ